MSTIDFDFQIPPFSATASQILAEINSPDVQVSQLIKLIECEPTIGSQVLRMANSPVYGCRREISTIGHAIVILGFRTVAQQAIAAATGVVFNSANDECGDARRQTYRESLSVATTGRVLSHHLRIANPDEAFLSGVMHDIGKLVLFQHAGSTYTEMLSEHPDGRTSDREIAHFGVSHPGLGKACGLKWGLPYTINKAIETHHDSVCELDSPLSQVVVMANYVARRWQIGFGLEAEIPVHADIEERIGDVDAASIRDEIADQFAAVEEICLGQAS
ncbi:HDOD domain-containing protein [Stieleria varia]|uniref:HDOD domain protein n=1 Tax=Stieleria varia TaxID=2528005 RepID=A0A5C6AQE1_9BACT|nr:HDOD domain-containing protein [Stieleria varia]TWU02165.1 HDOD domain protein [Stieleria varia]